MAFHKNKRILLGVTGGIAAYKTPDLVRQLKRRGARVRAVLTEAGGAFVAPLSLQAVSGHRVFTQSTEADDGMAHIELARWAEQILIAPATANFIAKIAQGRADDLLSTTILASTAELLVAPAMNQQMWQHATTQANLETLRAQGAVIIGPGSGDQACGEFGPGRMSEPEEIAAKVAGDGAPQLLAGKRVLITAGPTWEAIDPVRGLTNLSSGKMGFALAQAALDFGARVCIVSGPVQLQTEAFESDAGFRRVDVRSASQMLQAVMNEVGGADIFIGAAAVSDYQPREVAAQKIKKRSDTMTIELTKTPDILAQVAKSPNAPFSVGFAAETENLLQNAKQKLKDKGVDMIAANHVADGKVFGAEDNQVTLVDKHGKTELPRGDKYQVAVGILENIAQAMRG